MSGSSVQQTDRDWIHRCDDHAAARLRLLDDAEVLLGSGDMSSQHEALRLADRVELWRSGWLHERWGLSRSGVSPTRLTADRHLADGLDHLARRLRGAPWRPARWPRQAVADQHGSQRDEDDAPAAAAAAVLNPGVGLTHVCRAARRLTSENFAGALGRGQWPVHLYAPLYLSSHCANRCAYCAFAADQTLSRRQLEAGEAGEQAALLQARGLRHLLLVAGDFPRRTTPDYFAAIIQDLCARDLDIDLEIAAQTTHDYARLRQAGARGVTLYMETYDEEAYIHHHIRGPKVSYDWRLEALDRAAEAGFQHLGLGILLGLAEPAGDLLALVRHAGYLRARYPGCRLAFSLPRIHQAPEAFQVPFPVDDDMFVRMYAALRMAFPEATLVLSTREPPALRERLTEICVTRLSAASSTVPGGYEEAGTVGDSGGQFPVADDRPVAEMVAWLQQTGHQVIWSAADKVVRPCNPCVPAGAEP